MSLVKYVQYTLGLLICFLLGALLSPCTKLTTSCYGSYNLDHRPKGAATVPTSSPTLFRVQELLRNNITTESNLNKESPPNRTVSGSLGAGHERSSSPTYIDIDVMTPDIDDLYERLVIVTAFSENHYKEALGIIGTAQRQMPGKKIIVYNLGLENDTRKTVQSFCDVELRPFPFEKYPAFVSNLLMYSWKPIIINITLNEFGAIYWGDAAVRFQRSLKELIPLAKEHHGYLALIHSFDPKVKHAIKHQYYFTNSGMFDFLGINRSLYYEEKNASPHATANRQLFINSTTLQTKLVRPLVECALQKKCISPEGAKYGKHRYDASALALLLYKNMKYEWTPENNFNKEFNKVVRMERTNGERYEPKVCS